MARKVVLALRLLESPDVDTVTLRDFPRARAYTGDDDHFEALIASGGEAPLRCAV